MINNGSHPFCTSAKSPPKCQKPVSHRDILKTYHTTHRALVSVFQHRNFILRRWFWETLHFSPWLCSRKGDPVSQTAKRKEVPREKRQRATHKDIWQISQSQLPKLSPRVKRKITQTNEPETRELSSALLLTLLSHSSCFLVLIRKLFCSSMPFAAPQAPSQTGMASY